MILGGSGKQAFGMGDLNFSRRREFYGDSDEWNCRYLEIVVFEWIELKCSKMR